MSSPESKFKSPNSKKKNRSKAKVSQVEVTPTSSVGFPCRIKVSVAELRIYQQVNSSVVSVKLNLAIDDQTVLFESSQSEFKPANNSHNFTFESYNSSHVFLIQNSEQKRIITKVDILTQLTTSSTNGTSFIHALGVANVPNLNSLLNQKDPQKTPQPSQVSIPIMNGHTKVGEIKANIELQLEVSLVSVL